MGILCVCKGCVYGIVCGCCGGLGVSGVMSVYGVGDVWMGVVCVCVWLLAGIGGSIKDRKHTCPANGAWRKARLIGGCCIFRRGSWNSLGWVKLTPVKAGTMLR